MVDVSGLTEVKMKLFHGWRGTYYLDNSGTCVAKVCRECRETLPVSSFIAASDNSSGYVAKCKPCRYKIHNTRATKYSQTIRKRYANRSDEEIESDKLRLNPLGTKRCYKCETTKTVYDFFRSRQEPDGLYIICKTCSMAVTVRKKRNKFIPYWESMGIPLECYVCGGPWEASDHVVAEKNNGSNEAHNRLPICKPCNSSKWKNPLEKWIREKHPDIADEVLHRVTVEYGISI